MFGGYGMDNDSRSVVASPSVLCEGQHSMADPSVASPGQPRAATLTLPL